MQDPIIEKATAYIKVLFQNNADGHDALGAIGIARTFAYGGKNGRTLEDSIRHFHDKLLLLKDSLNTEEAREMAEERHAFLLKFLEEYQNEQ